VKPLCQIRISSSDYERLHRHLFPGDRDEHGAILLAGISRVRDRKVFHVREIHLAEEGTDYVEGKIGYRALSPMFIHKMITRARDEKLAYFAVHNHDTDDSVGFSRIDIESHERGYPALLQISRGMPVGALVFGHRSVAADIWLADKTRLELDEMVIVGKTIRHLAAHPEYSDNAPATYERQIRMFGRVGQARLAKAHVVIIGLGGIGSLVTEYLARLGVGRFTLVDGDLVEESNLSRIVGATHRDAEKRSAKVAVAKNLILQANTLASVKVLADDVAKESIAKQLVDADYIFLAADSMRARLVFNALVHQYLIPGVQLGSKIRCDLDNLALLDVMSANRPVRPGSGCLWCNQFIDPSILAIESKSDEERKAQAYGVAEPNPSVISLNAVSAAHAVNDFLLDYLALRRPEIEINYEHFHFLDDRRSIVAPRRDDDCPECSRKGRFGQGDSVPLPCIDG
jgi:ThiF family